MKNGKNILLLGLLAAGLSACGPQSSSSTDNSGSSKGNKEYDLLVWEDQSKSAGIEEAVKTFEEEHDVTIKVVEKAYADQLEDLRLDGPAGTGADVITIPGDQIGTAVTEGLLKEMTVEQAVQDIYTEAAMQSQIVNGKVYGLPKAVETQILYYNKALISEEELPKTTDEWLTYSKKVKTDSSYGLLALWDQIYYAQGVLGGYGGYVFGTDADGSYNPEDIGLATDGAIKGAEYIKEFYDSGVFPTGIIGEQGINVLDSLFTEGKAAAVISGPWNLEPYKEAGIDYGVMELPLLGNGEHMSSFIGVKSYNVSSYSQNADLAEEFVAFITNEENSKVRFEKTAEIPAVEALATDESILESESAAAIAEQSKHAELTPGITAMNSVWEPIDSALQTIATGKAEPKTALPQAVEQIKSAIAATQN
ncbi:extracellular solute-binding protein [Enterococcus sp. BWR-S5]|uniref:extracellular solute-binding protein n=1 Tax=Enterococcus sp. BWR-S5 TaxID=2787714 RepID=UPI00192069D1|nr:extracellular solute-binding protein [Enterococcus sp. BWR-S5]MBL1224112.1 extracellular solute-binding protein [Enterococcus sp. BWR-S5]